MKPSSFRQDGQQPPARYRTPSPPIDAFEPLSPQLRPQLDIETHELPWPTSHQAPDTFNRSMNTREHNDNGRRRQSFPDQDSISTLASIALSTPQRWPAQNKRHAPTTPASQLARYSEHGSERPAKRARSEKLPSPEWLNKRSPRVSRPVTSYEHVTDSMAMEAELLLNLHHPVRFSTSPRKMPCPSDHVGSTENTNGIVQRPSLGQAGQDAANSLSAVSMDIAPDRSPFAPLQASLGARSEQLNHSSRAPLQSSEVPKPPEAPSLDFRHQLIEASKLSEPSISIRHAGTAAPGASRKTMQQDLSSLGFVDGNTRGCTRSDQQSPHSARSRDRPGMKSGQIPSGLYEESKSRLEPEKMPKSQPSIQDEFGLVEDYRPSMLATTVERSAVGWSRPFVPALRGDVLQYRQAAARSDVLDATTSVVGGTSYATEPSVCASCKFVRNSINAELDLGSTSWINCDGCQSWFHFACAGFKNEREVRAVDKYRCRKCRSIHGPTTYVRKSSRAHTAIDYAGLNQGVVKTSDERPEHHYIQPIKDGTISLQPENFARMRPELVTAEHFEKGHGMKEPIVIPAEFNPRPSSTTDSGASSADCVRRRCPSEGDAAVHDDYFAWDPESHNVPDHGQDALDMVIPPDLTVRQVAELYGPEEKVEVIDVKSQNGEGKKWNMRRWADYYENTSNKVVRNVISLEVSQSTLGRLIRRPQIVRDLDLQDSVWPAELQAKGEFPRVQFYCLMSVADCFTDFHIDFGGSSVFYHILKGKKTFFFIPPKEKHLKKYEEWCRSPAQNWTFLGDQTKECYRVDLSVGDTMLIPAGWIHAVWTPEDSLVIGGNFLTRLSYSMQLRITQIEKATGVARKFRYPHFQKIQWFTAIRYLERDPLPFFVRQALESGQLFRRQYPAYHDFNSWGENSVSGPENYHARYYSQAELEGLPDLVRYLLRTALIDSGEITEGITAETRNAVKKSIPRGFGEPLEIVKTFAIWCAWKRGNELIPHWADPKAQANLGMPVSIVTAVAAAAKKATGAAASRGPRRHSSRNQVQQALNFGGARKLTLEAESRDCNLELPSTPTDTKPLWNEAPAPDKFCMAEDIVGLQHVTPKSKDSGKRKPASSSGTGSHRKTACDSCRKRRRACKHNADPNFEISPNLPSTPEGSLLPFLSTQSVYSQDQSVQSDQSDQHKPSATDMHTGLGLPEQYTDNRGEIESANPNRPIPDVAPDLEVLTSIVQEPHEDTKAEIILPTTDNQQRTYTTPSHYNDDLPAVQQIRGRSKACGDCRKSKLYMRRLMAPQRRCIHDENGMEDPVKAQETKTPRSGLAPKRRKLNNRMQDTPTATTSYNKTSPQESSTSLETIVPSSISTGESLTLSAPTAGNDPFFCAMPKSDEGLASNTHQPSPPPHDQESASIQSQDPVGATQSEALATMHPSSHGVAFQPNHHPTTAAPAPDGLEHQFSPPVQQVETRSNDFDQQPAASSLASPPPSSHDDYEQRPAQGPADSKTVYSSSSSRQSSRHATIQAAQRFTPESAPTRRDSSSSAAGAIVDTSLVIETRTPSTTSPTAITGSGQKKMKVRPGSDIEADEESWLLIKQLQAEEYGLRRRGRGMA
ncbi:MAG: hypothetical protein Q9174_000483 [Haloplaca sp. 1 TL-2023]